MWARILLGCAAAGCVGAPAFEECAVRCGTGDLCPEGQTCLSDRYCHPHYAERLCTTADAGADGGVPADGAVRDVVEGPYDAPVLDVPAACQPSTDESPCVVCAKERCCDLLSPCLQDVTCSCYVECFINTGGTTSCSPACGPPNGLTADLETCRQEQCPGQCAL